MQHSRPEVFMADEEKEITASEIIGELTRAVRTLRVFENVQDVIKFIATQEQYKKKLADSVAALENRHLKLQENIDSMNAIISELEAKETSLEDTISKSLETTKGTASTIIAEATTKAMNIVREANAQVKNLESTKEDLRKQIGAISNEKVRVESEFNSLFEQVTKKKKELLTSLGL
jgi:chromosome segregation ATPase